MASFTQTAQWLAGGFIGRIPVWNTAGYEVGYRDSYDTMTVHFNASYQGEKYLASKDIYGNDIKLTLPSSPIPVGTVATTATATSTSGGTSTNTNVTSAAPSQIFVATSAPAVVGTISTAMSQYKVPLIAGAGAVALLWLLLGSRK